MIVFLILFLVALSGANYLLFRDALYPAFVQSVLWTVLCGVILGLEQQYWPLRTLTLITIGAGSFCFSMSCYLATYGHQPRKHRAWRIVEVPGRGSTMLATALSAGLLPFYVLRALQIAEAGPLDSFFFNLRWMLNEGGESFGPIEYAILFSFFASAVAVGRLYIGNRAPMDVTLAIVAVVSAFTYATFASGRTFFFILVFLLMTPMVVLRYVSAAKAGLIGGGVLLGLFVLIGVFLRSISQPDSIAQIAPQAFNSFMHYLIGGTYALDTLLHQNMTLDYGANTFRFFYSLANAMGYDVEVKPLVQEFSYPFPTNVYTIYQPYLMDLGLGFAMLIMILLGGFHGFLYRKVTGQEIRFGYLIVLSVAMYPLFMQFFQDQYFNLTSTWIQFTIVYLLFVKHRALIKLLVPGI